MFEVIVGSTDGVYRLNGSQPEHLGVEGERIWAIHAWQDAGDTSILAGSYGNGIFRSTNAGKTWTQANEGLTATALRTIQPDPLNSGAILCGTEPARGFRSTDGGQSWRELATIATLPAVEQWYLPYSPRAGAIRNFYAPTGGSNRLLGSIEVGGLLNSNDGGATWDLVDIQPDDDIHYITGHPQDPNLLYAALGWASLEKDRRREDPPPLGGIGRSRDGGKSWRKLHSDYTRAVIVPPTRPDLVLAGPATRVGHEGRIEVSANSGDTWETASSGTEFPMEDMVELFVAAPDNSIWAVCSGGRLLRAQPGEWNWTAAVPEDAGIDVQSICFVAES